MDLVDGLRYNVRGLVFALKRGKLLLLGLVRFLLVVLITAVLAGLVLAYQQQLMDLMWSKPESPWILWLWYVVSWLLTLFLVGISAIFSYLVSQILFSVLIMDYMSRITEQAVTGQVRQPEGINIFRTFIHLVRQEIPRAILPVLASMVIMVLGWVLALLGPIMVLVSSCLAIIFLAWDNTDLTPARRLVPFNERWRFLRKSLLFHLGFGLPFLVPALNLLFLAYAPVGATLYYLDKQDGLKASK